MSQKKFVDSDPIRPDDPVIKARFIITPLIVAYGILPPILDKIPNVDKEKHYNQAIDIIRIISILAVVAIHTTTRTIEISHENLVKVPFSLLVNQLARFAVPMFIMISGFVLELNYKNHDSYTSYLKKRLSRIFIPYLFWSVAYYFLIYKNHSGNFIEALITGSASYQLYFIPTLLIFYIIFPLLHKYYKVVSNKWIFLSLGVLEIIFLRADYFYHSITIFYPLAIALLNYYVFLIGMITSRNQEQILNFVKKYKYLLISLTLVSGSFVFYEGQITFYRTYNYLSFYSQWRPSVLIYTILLSSLLFYFGGLKNLKFIKKLASLSFFVFFIHVIFLEVFWPIFGLYKYPPIFFLIVSIASFAIAFIIHKIPKLKILTG